MTLDILILPSAVQAVIVPSDNQDSDQFINAGVQYGGGSLMWGATMQLQTLIDTSAVFTSQGNVTGLPDTLARGQSAVVTATIATVTPSADISFSIFNPLGFDDVFDIGKPELEIGSSFGCSETKEWKPDMRRSLSGKSVGYVQYDLPFAMNIDSARDVSKTENKIQIKFSLTAMKDVDAEGQYPFTVAISVGIDDVISVTQDINITDSLHSPTVGSGEISLTTPTLLGNAYAGGTAAFQVDITVPAGKSFELKTSGSVANEQIKASGLAIISAGVCSGFLKEAIFDHSLESSFGKITNADSSASTIELMVVLELSEAATGQISEAITIDGVTATMTGTITAPAELGDVIGTGTGLGLAYVDDILKKFAIMPGFAVGVRSEVVLPASVLNKPLTLEVFQESQQVDHIRICRIEVEQVGLGHPCTIPFKDPSFAETHVTFSKSVDTMEEADMVTVNAGHTCPIGVPNNPKVNASLVFSFYYDIPVEDSESVSDGASFVLAGALYVDQTALWTTHTEVEKIDPMEIDGNYGIEAWDNSQTLTQPYMTARIINEKVSINGILAIRFVIKLNKFTRGKIQFYLRNDNPHYSVTCSLKVVTIGKNFGCAKSPEEYTRKNVMNFCSSCSGTYNGVAYYNTHLEIENLMNYGTTDLQSNMYADDDSIDLMAFFRIRERPGGNSPIRIVATLNGQDKTIDINDIESEELTYNTDFNVDIIPVQADESLSNAPLHAAKTIAMEVTIPKRWNFYKVRFYSNDTDFDEKITMCSIQVTKVGKNLPCLSTWNSFTKNYYTDKYDPIPTNSQYGIGLQMKIEACHFDYSRDPAENKFQVEFTFKPTMKANEGDVINIVAEVESLWAPRTVSSTQAITLSNSVVPSNFLNSKSIFPRVMENKSLANYDTETETEIEGKV